MISTKDNFNSKNIKILSIDFETRPIADGMSTKNQIFAPGFYSNTGFKESIHLEDREFRSDEVKFIRYIIYKIQSFQGIITGWYLANSDLVVLDEVCKRIGVTSPIGFYEVPLLSSEEEDEDVDGDDPNGLEHSTTSVISYPYLKDKKIIDMYKVFHHGFIKNSVYPLNTDICSWTRLQLECWDMVNILANQLASKSPAKMLQSSHLKNRKSMC